MLGMSDALLCGCGKMLALEVTNVYENGDTNFHYEYCEDLKDGRGYTAGIAGFCSGTGDAWQMVQAYHKLTGGKDDMSQFDTEMARLAKLSDSGKDASSVSGLPNYCAVWKKLGNSDPKFKQAQDQIRDQMYFTPAMDQAKILGLKTTIAQAQLYDTALEHGAGDDADGLISLIKRTNAKVTSDVSGTSGSTLTINGHKIDEIAWLNLFLDVRTADLEHPLESGNQGGNYWAQTTYRVKSYQYIIKQKQYNWGTSVNILDNDGKPMTVKCSTSPVNTKRKRANKPCKKGNKTKGTKPKDSSSNDSSPDGPSSKKSKHSKSGKGHKTMSVDDSGN
ncbi:hypothetical protein H4S07_006557 [Coemansia furcata]|uniref:Uncharacterized protein n=1 Tax=Coemansia furcata TaxID=417177 RepID=A0ACC1KU59_9FUNG|nr:hypothetical protein H4S07_006557 [Coemansia furcata]